MFHVGFAPKSAHVGVGKVSEVEHVVDHPSGRAVPNLHTCVKAGRVGLLLDIKFWNWKGGSSWAQPNEAIALFNRPFHEMGRGWDRGAFT
jgi:hypothetical protein